MTDEPAARWRSHQSARCGSVPRNEPKIAAVLRSHLLALCAIGVRSLRGCRGERRSRATHRPRRNHARRPQSGRSGGHSEADATATSRWASRTAWIELPNGECRARDGARESSAARRSPTVRRSPSDSPRPSPIRPQCTRRAADAREPIGGALRPPVAGGDAASLRRCLRPAASATWEGSRSACCRASEYARHAVLCALVAFLHPDLYGPDPASEVRYEPECAVGDRPRRADRVGRRDRRLPAPLARKPQERWRVGTEHEKIGSTDGRLTPCPSRGTRHRRPARADRRRSTAGRASSRAPT